MADADQMVRGTIVSPWPGKSKGSGMPRATTARSHRSRADYVGGDRWSRKSGHRNGRLYAVIATPALMLGVGRLGTVLGPRADANPNTLR